MSRHLVRKWLGTRESYNTLKESPFLDPWTIYYVRNADGSTVEYFGDNIVTVPTGQLLPVNDILEEEPDIQDVNPYDRFLVGTDNEGYKVVEYTLNNSYELVKEEMDFDWRYGVRVKSQDLKNYIYFDGKLRSYDDVYCGEF